MAVEIAALDLWTLLVENVFGGFWLTVVGLGLVQFIIMGVLGKMSIYTVTWIIVMFVVTLSIGYGYLLLNILITSLLLIAVFFSWRSYIDSKS